MNGHVQRGVFTDNGEYTVGATAGGTTGIAVLHHQRTGLSFFVDHVRVAHQLVGERALKGKETTQRVELPARVVARKHLSAKS